MPTPFSKNAFGVDPSWYENDDQRMEDLEARRQAAIQEKARQSYERRFGMPNPKGASDQWMGAEDQIRQFQAMQAKQAQEQEMRRRLMLANLFGMQ